MGDVPARAVVRSGRPVVLTASPLFKASLKNSHRAMSRVTVLAPGTSSGFVDAGELSIASGSLSIDGTRNVWRTGTFNLAPTTTFDIDALLAIDSTYRLRIERGIMYADGTDEWVTIGLLQVQDVSNTISRGSADITASDLGSLIDDYSLITPYAPLGITGTPLTAVAAIQDLVATAIVWDTIPGWDIDPAISTTLIPTTGTVFNGSRWDAIKALAESLGAVVSVGVDGRWRIKTAIVDADSPAATYSSGTGGILIDYTLSRSRSEQYNAVPLVWESPGSGGLAFIVDSDPASPTYWDGPFGKRPRPSETNATITTSTQAITAATALLDQYKGRSLALDFSSVHDPLLEPGDVIEVTAPGVSQVHVVDTIGLQLAGGQMSVSTRMIREA